MSLINKTRKVARYLKWVKTLSYRHKKIELLRRISPSVQKRYELDNMVGPIGYWKELQEYQIGTLKHLGLKPDHSLLDIGCGPLQGGLAFIEYLNDEKYTGIDLKKEPLEAGISQLRELGLLDKKKPRLLVSDSFGEKELEGRQFDYVWCSQMLYNQNEEILDFLFLKLSKFLGPQGRFYGDIIGDPARVGENDYWHGFRFYPHTVASVSEIAKKHRLSVKGLGPIHSYGYPSEITSLCQNELLEVSKL